MHTGSIEYASCPGLHVFRLVGDVRHTGGSSLQDSAALDAFIQRAREAEGAQEICIDLRETTGIDSTHLGLLVRLMGLSSSGSAKIVSTRPAITKLLYTMGLNTVFTITEDATALDAALADAPTAPLPHSETGRDSRAVIRDAHKALAGLSEANQRAFQNLITLLEQEAAKEDGDGH